MNWDTALAWINAACEVEPAPVLSIPPIIVVSEPDQTERQLRSAQAFLQLLFADVDIEYNEEEKEEPIEEMVVPCWGSSTSSWDATEDEEGCDQFGAVPDRMEGEQDSFSVCRV